MSFDAALIHEVTIRRRTRTGEDEQGIDVYTWSDVDTSPAWVEQTDAREVREGRDAILTDWLVFLPNEADVNGHDQIIFEDKTLEVVGTPAARSTFTGLHHFELNCRLVEGG